jgi:Transposase DDE domain group 1
MIPNQVLGAANAVRLQLHALAYNLGNFLRTQATPEPINDRSLTSLKEKPIKIGAKVVSHGRYITFQMAEVVIPRVLFADILRLIVDCGRRLIQRRHDRLVYPFVGTKAIGEVRLDEGKIDILGLDSTAVADLGALAASMTTAPAC